VTSPGFLVDTTAVQDGVDKPEIPGAVHERDRNAARNILAAGHRCLAEGIPAL